MASSHEQPSEERPSSSRRVYTPAVVASLSLGAALVLLSGVTARLGSAFEYGSDHAQRPYLLVVYVLVAMGLIYLVLVFLWTRRHRGIPPFLWVVAIGLSMRVLMMFSVPIQEDDYYRYLWDGAVTAHGYNPFAYIPADVYALADTPKTLKMLSEDSGDVIRRVNHSELATIYPPVAQAAFVAAYLLKPWSLMAWRIVLLLFDGATLALLVILLRQFGKPIGLAGIYWWNPLVVKELFNSAHMDGLILPFVLAALLFALRSSPARTGVALVLATCVKVWPLILAPLAIRGLKSTPRNYMRAGILSFVLLGVMCLPLRASIELGESSGFFAYSERWEMNDAAFMVIAKVAEAITAISGMNDRESFAGALSRFMAAAVIGAIIVGLCWRPVRNAQDLSHRFALAVGALFLLSPTQFPWYYVWMVPLLALSPRPSFLIMTLTLPLYYLKFYFIEHGDVSLFHHGVVWIEFAPVAVLLLWEWRTGWAAQSEPQTA